MLQEIDKIIEKPKSTEALSKPTEKTPKSYVKTRSKKKKYYEIPRIADKNKETQNATGNTPSSSQR